MFKCIDRTQWLNKEVHIFSPESNHNVEKEDIMMGDKPNNKETIENAEKVSGKNYEVSDYKSEEQLNKGLAITHEQVSDGYMEGTVDEKIDEVDQQGNLTSHDGEAIRRKGFNE